VRFSSTYKGKRRDNHEIAYDGRGGGSSPAVRFRLKHPWMDFMTFFGTQASGAAWVVPKKYLERVGDDGFKKAPAAPVPYRFVSFNPGIELVLELYGSTAQDTQREAPDLQDGARRSGRD